MTSTLVRRWSIVGLAFTFGLLTSLVLLEPGLRGASGQQPNACVTQGNVTDDMLHDLVRMNRKMAKLIHDDPFTGGKRANRANEIEDIKLELTDKFPSVFGLPFRTLYRALHVIDLFLFNYVVEGELKDLKQAKKFKEGLEKLLRNSPCQAPGQ